MRPVWISPFPVHLDTLLAVLGVTVISIIVILGAAELSQFNNKQLIYDLVSISKMGEPSSIFAGQPRFCCIQGVDNFFGVGAGGLMNCSGEASS